MLELLILVVTVSALAALSWRAERRFARHDRLPMQWSLGGSVNWTAPRRVALAVTPALGTLVMLATAASAWGLTPRPGQEGLVTPVLLLIGGGLVAMHGLHLRMIGRSLRR